MAGVSLDHFIDAQNTNFKIALTELTEGKKRSHWIWYIFPQIAEFGHSERSKKYSIKTRREAKAFIHHPVLSANYLSCLDALLLHTEKDITKVLGGIDASKLNSSLTLFKGVSNNPDLQQKISNTLSSFFDGNECEKTKAFLSTQSTFGFKLGFRPRFNAS